MFLRISVFFFFCFEDIFLVVSVSVTVCQAVFVSGGVVVSVSVSV